MDLLEIRKKAKEKKEAKARAKKAESGQKPGEKPPPQAEPPAPPVKKRVKKKSAVRQAKKDKKPQAGAGPKQGPPDEPGVKGLADALGEAEEARAQDAAVPAGEEPTAEAANAPAAEVPAEEPPTQEQEAGTADEGFAGEEEAEEDVVEYLAFMLSAEEYAVRVEDVNEIIRPQKITMVPRAEEFVEGIISLRGVIIPVYDIKKRLGLESSETGRSARIVIVSDNGRPQGIMVDKVTGVARLRESAIEPPPAVIGGVEGEYLDGVGRIDGRLIILFNTKKVLAMDGVVGG